MSFASLIPDPEGPWTFRTDGSPKFLSSSSPSYYPAQEDVLLLVFWTLPDIVKHFVPQKQPFILTEGNPSRRLENFCSSSFGLINMLFYMGQALPFYSLALVPFSLSAFKLRCFWSFFSTSHYLDHTVESLQTAVEAEKIGDTVSIM